MTTIKIEIVKKNSPKNRELLNYIYDNIDMINNRGYLINFAYAKDKGKYPSINFNTNGRIVKENGVNQIKNIINQIISSNVEEGFIGGNSSSGGDIRDQMMSLMSGKENDDEDHDDALTDDKIRARTRAINSMRRDRWDTKNETHIREPEEKKKSSMKKNNGSVSSKTPTDDVFGQLLMNKIAD